MALTQQRERAHDTSDDSHAVLSAYDALVADGDLDRDAAQVAVACALDDVLDDLANATRGGIAPFFRRRLGRTASVRGLYLWGSVGRGKTMLMDIFYEAAPVKAKRRLHFNKFMADAHGRIARLRKEGADEAVLTAADEIAAESHLLCFDEFAVTDIADAMILSRLFTRLFEKKVTLVATSNVAPNDLYRDGLNRALFEPFIRVLRDHVEVVQLDAATDYRLNRLEDRQVYFQTGDKGFERTWIAAMGDREETGADVKVGSRTIHAPRVAGGMARFSFAELCDAPRSAGDFMAIANRFHTLFIEDVPVLTRARRESLRRFINLIDVLYDQSVRLVISAAAEPARLLDTDGGGAEQEAFAFDRTASRLYEMRSASYLHGVETTPYG
ncbi:cell division protein ZapE [Acuticoccus sp. MNP-M23]|uniref:cell division protein ZapE n=1 Tax=Acuticoccus sp. MNP-M23 TaxID=3072793 RepID=UPI0028158024|nr:cell division protein ZapE [Acuticoccus sp. MNP-M23]WMS44881.1 cell division protein ZapE [Acuticoccus sp. MNP-M23]